MTDPLRPSEAADRWPETWESYAAFGDFLSPEGPRDVARWRVVEMRPREAANDWALALARAYEEGDPGAVVGFEGEWPTRAQAEDDLRRVGELAGEEFREPVLHDGVELVDGHHRVAAALADGRRSIRVLVPA
jgi:hypothetical protein